MRHSVNVPVHAREVNRLPFAYILEPYAGVCVERPLQKTCHCNVS